MYGQSKCPVPMHNVLGYSYSVAVEEIKAQLITYETQTHTNLSITQKSQEVDFTDEIK